jgi:hypothetical protein
VSEKVNSHVSGNRYGDFSTSASHVIVEFWLPLRNARNPSQYHMKTCHKGKLSNRNVGSKDQGALTKIYAKFTSMPYACKEHIQVYVVAK